MDETHPLKKTENISVKSILLSNKKILLNYVIRRIVMETPGFSEMNHTQPQFRKCGFYPIFLALFWEAFGNCLLGIFLQDFTRNFLGILKGILEKKKSIIYGRSPQNNPFHDNSFPFCAIKNFMAHIFWIKNKSYSLGCYP